MEVSHSRTRNQALETVYTVSSSDCSSELLQCLADPFNQLPLGSLGTIFPTT